MPTSDYQITGPVADLVPYPVLQYLLLTDPVLGSSDAGVPDGPFNRVIHKLHKNTEAIGTVLLNYLNRTVGAVESAMPVPYVVPNTVPGAPSTPGDGVFHSLYYTDREVILQYDAQALVPGWVYKFDVSRVNQILIRTAQSVSVPLSTEDDTVVVEVPEGFSVAHLKSFYVVTTGEPGDTPIVSVLPMVFSGETVIRLTLSTTPALPDTYTLVCLFERFESV